MSTPGTAAKRTLRSNASATPSSESGAQSTAQKEASGSQRSTDLSSSSTRERPASKNLSFSSPLEKSGRSVTGEVSAPRSSSSTKHVSSTTASAVTASLASESRSGGAGDHAKAPISATKAKEGGNHSKSKDDPRQSSHSSSKTSSGATEPLTPLSTAKRILKAMIDHGSLIPGKGVLMLEYVGKRIYADLDEEGDLWYQQDRFTSPTAMTTLMKQKANPKTSLKSDKGWHTLIEVRTGRALKDIKDEFFKEFAAQEQTTSKASSKSTKKKNDENEKPKSNNSAPSGTEERRTSRTSVGGAGVEGSQTPRNRIATTPQGGRSNNQQQTEASSSAPAQTRREAAEASSSQAPKEKEKIPGSWQIITGNYRQKKAVCCWCQNDRRSEGLLPCADCDRFMHRACALQHIPEIPDEDLFVCMICIKRQHKDVINYLSAIASTPLAPLDGESADPAAIELYSEETLEEVKRLKGAAKDLLDIFAECPDPVQRMTTGIGPFLNALCKHEVVSGVLQYSEQMALLKSGKLLPHVLKPIPKDHFEVASLIQATDLYFRQKILIKNRKQPFLDHLDEELRRQQTECQEELEEVSIECERADRAIRTAQETISRKRRYVEEVLPKVLEAEKKADEVDKLKQIVYPKFIQETFLPNLKEFVASADKMFWASLESTFKKKLAQLRSECDFIKRQALHFKERLVGLHPPASTDNQGSTSMEVDSPANAIPPQLVERYQAFFSSTLEKLKAHRNKISSTLFTLMEFLDEHELSDFVANDMEMTMSSLDTLDVELGDTPARPARRRKTRRVAGNPKRYHSQL